MSATLPMSDVLPTRVRPFEKTQKPTPPWLRLLLGRALAPPEAVQTVPSQRQAAPSMMVRAAGARAAARAGTAPSPCSSCLMSSTQAAPLTWT